MVYLSSRFTKELVDAYMNNATFHAVVTEHEIEGSSYTAMLEDAVVKLVADIESMVKLAISRIEERDP
jgi:hypothetical protein